MKAQSPLPQPGGPQNAISVEVIPSAFVSAVGVGIFLALGLVKFGNPIVLDKMVEKPGNLEAVLFQPWPASWGHIIFGVLSVVIICLRASSFRLPRGLAWAPLVWLGWQVLAGTSSLDPVMTRSTLVHFAVTVGCYYLGYCFLGNGLARVGSTLPLLLGFGYMLWVGMDQHFGGLAASREHFYKEHPQWQQEFSAEFIKRINSERIFSTLVYPNALAGAVLLFLPVLGAMVWELFRERRRLIGLVGLGGLIYGGGACLIWSGSKAGWLIALGMLGVVGLRYSANTWKRWVLITILGVLGLGFFAWRYQGYFSKGATSVGARFDYWKAAMDNARERPGFGSGPGTFAKVYAERKRPESEMARLVHNDYLQQASDSGISGAMLYVLMLPVALFLLYRYSFGSDERFWIWLALLGFGIQSMVEFGLYIPALAWTAYFWLGGMVSDRQYVKD